MLDDEPIHTMDIPGRSRYMVPLLTRLFFFQPTYVFHIGMGDIVRLQQFKHSFYAQATKDVYTLSVVDADVVDPKLMNSTMGRDVNRTVIYANTDQ